MPSAVTPSHTLAQASGKPRRNPLRRYAPTRVNEHTRWRFLRNRREELLERLGGTADIRQAMAIDMIAKSEWQLFVAERDAEAAPDAKQRFYANRMVTDARKQCLLWNRELVAASNAASKAAPTQPPGAALDEHIAQLRQRTRRGDVA